MSKQDTVSLLLETAYKLDNNTNIEVLDESMSIKDIFTGSILTLALILAVGASISCKIEETKDKRADKKDFSKMEYFQKCHERIKSAKYVKFSKEEFEVAFKHLGKFEKINNEFNSCMKSYVDTLQSNSYHMKKDDDRFLKDLNNKYDGLKNFEQTAWKRLDLLTKEVKNDLSNCKTNSYCEDVNEFLKYYDKYVSYMPSDDYNEDDPFYEMGIDGDDFWEQVNILYEYYLHNSARDEEPVKLEQKIYDSIESVVSIKKHMNQLYKKFFTACAPYAKIQIYGKKKVDTDD